MAQVMSYLWLKALHIIFTVAWFAGLFYIFRLFVYHVKHKDNPSMAAVFTTMEKKLLYIIMYPAMTLTLLFGFLLISLNPAVLTAPWFHFKIGGVFVLVGYHLFAGKTYKHFSRGKYWLSEKACRRINEIPTIMLILIILMVVLKPL